MKQQTFFNYLREQKKWLMLTSLLSVVGFILLKFCYPLLDFDADSVNYVAWAYNDLKIAYRPLGYSNFLELIHDHISTSMFAVALVQYLLFFLSVLFAFLSIDFFLRIPYRLKLALMILVFFNPILIIQANTVLSDSLFTSLTVMLIVLCIWFSKTGKWWFYLMVLVVFFFCFEVRFTAMFYPVIIIASIVISRLKASARLMYSSITLIFVVVLVHHHKSFILKTAGVEVLSGFSGWQIANNALYCYKETDIVPEDLPTPQMKVIDLMVKQSIDSVELTTEVGVDYLWNKRSPFRKYVFYNMHFNHMTYFTNWYRISPDLNDYGWYIIKNYPGAFARCYLYPNFKRFFYPALGSFEKYDSEDALLPVETRYWFDIEFNTTNCRFPHLQQSVISFYRPFCVLLNLLNIAISVFLLFKIVRARKCIPDTLLIVGIIWITYYFSFMIFSVFAAAVYLRFLDTVFAIGLLIPLAIWTNCKNLIPKKVG